MKVLVTGDEGQLARSIRECGNDHPDIKLQFVSRPTFDLMIPETVRSTIADAAPDVVVNAAAYTAVDRAEDEPDIAFQINAAGAEAVASAAESIGAGVIQISTDYVFDGRKSSAYLEDDKTNPLGIYGESKLEGEQRIRSANPKHFIVRTGWVYSPFGQNFVKSIMNAARTRDGLRVVADQFGNPTSALDLAEGLLRMVGANAWGETYHLAGAGSTSWHEFAREIMAQCSDLGLASVPVEPIRTDEWPTRARRPACSILNSDKFAADFCFSMPARQGSLRKVVQMLAATI